VVSLVDTPRILISVAAPAKDQRSVFMKGVGRQLHPRTLRFGSRFIAGTNPDRHHGRSRSALSSETGVRSFAGCSQYGLHLPIYS
jgi:hypothetical protein